jgi:uncharacterized membrane protein
MSSSRSLSRRTRSHLIAASAAVLVIGCVADSVTLPPEQLPAFAKAAATGLTVTSTLPKSGDKGKTLDVHVYGNGFAAGATATWALHGVADPSKVRTNSTTVVSSSELIANITIAPDATIDYWDVQVSAAFCCKTGVGTELFEVTSAMPVGPGTALSVNDAGDIAGAFGSSGKVGHAYVVSGENASFSDLGLQQARAISQDGQTAVGGIGSGIGQPIAAVWTRASRAAAWPLSGTKLPDPPGTTFAVGRANGVATLSAENVTLIAGFVTTPATAVYWESTDGTWTSPARLLPIPAGYVATNNSVMAMAANGDIAGQLLDPSGNSLAVVWRRVVGGYVADLLPRPSGYAIARLRSISPDGTILGGNVRVSSTGKDVLAPAFWTRDANGVYTVRLLPTLTGANGGLDVAVFGVTVVGGQVRAVGTSPSPTNGTYLHAVSWTWTAGGSDFVVRDIGGVGTRSDVFPYAINAAGTIAVGGDGSGSIKWLLQP